jgi:transposase InsO family protein
VVAINKQSALMFIKPTCRFGIPNQFITDRGTQFTSKAFQTYCDDIGIKMCNASVAHSRSNGQVKQANAVILKGLKTRTYSCLKKHDKGWVDELLCVLWANHTSSSRATGEMLFFLVYGMEVVLPPKIAKGSP